MGRSKNDDRQKKGTTSSSSQAAAELVSRQSPNAFVGFQSLQNNPVFLAAGGQGGHVDGSGSDLLTDSKFKIVFKSLLKRDAVTKVKALQSLGELIKTADEAAVVQSLVYWPQLYNKLAVDGDRRTRLETNSCMCGYATRAQKQLAPYLKKLLPHWLCCQHDVYADVSAVAVSAFDALFAEKKQAEVLSFCAAEISSLLVDNLVLQKTDAISDVGKQSPDERQSRLHLIVSSSLGALTTFVDKVPHDVSKPLLDQIVASKKFWSLLQSDSVEIRGRFYTLLLCAVSADQTGIEANMSLAAPAVLSMCGEKQSGLQTAMWNTYLTVLQQMPCIWVTVKKGAITHLKLWKMLSSAGHGSPALALPCCVPLLSVLPSHVRRDVLFVDKWLSCTWEGVTVCATDTQRNVVVNGYVEALAYLSKDARECEDSHALLSKMWLGHTLATVAEAMTTNQMALDCRTLFNGVAGILSTGCVPSDIQTEFTTQLKQAAVAKSEADVANSAEHGASIARAACEHLSPALIAFVQFGGATLVAFASDMTELCMASVAKGSIAHISLVATVLRVVHSQSDFFDSFYAATEHSMTHVDIVEAAFVLFDSCEPGAGVDAAEWYECVVSLTLSAMYVSTERRVDYLLWARLMSHADHEDVPKKQQMRLAMANELTQRLTNGESKVSYWRSQTMESFAIKTALVLGDPLLDDGTFALYKAVIAVYQDGDYVGAIVNTETLDNLLKSCLKGLQKEHDALLEMHSPVLTDETSLRRLLAVCEVFFQSYHHFEQDTRTHARTVPMATTTHNAHTDTDAHTHTVIDAHTSGAANSSAVRTGSGVAITLGTAQHCYTEISTATLPLLSYALGLSSLLLPVEEEADSAIDDDLISQCIHVFTEGLAVLIPPASTHTRTYTQTHTRTHTDGTPHHTRGRVSESDDMDMTTDPKAGSRRHLGFICVRRIVKSAEEAPLAVTSMSRMESYVAELLLVLNSLCCGSGERQACMQLALTRTRTKIRSSTTNKNTRAKLTHKHSHTPSETSTPTYTYTCISALRLPPNHLTPLLDRLPYVMNTRHVMTGVLLIDDKQYDAHDSTETYCTNTHTDTHTDTHAGTHTDSSAGGIVRGDGCPCSRKCSGDGALVPPDPTTLLEIARLCVFRSALFASLVPDELYVDWSEDKDEDVTTNYEANSTEPQTLQAVVEDAAPTPVHESVAVAMEATEQQPEIDSQSNHAADKKHSEDHAHQNPHLLHIDCGEGDVTQARIRQLLVLIGTRLYLQCALKTHSGLAAALDTHPCAGKGYVRRVIATDNIPALLSELLVQLEMASKAANAVASVAMLSRILAAAGVLNSEQDDAIVQLPMKGDVVASVIKCAVKHGIINANTVEVLTSTLSSQVDLSNCCNDTMNMFMIHLNTVAAMFPHSAAMSSVRDACVLSVLEYPPDALYTHTKAVSNDVGERRTLSALAVINCTLQSKLVKRSLQVSRSPSRRSRSRGKSDLTSAHRSRGRVRCIPNQQHKQCMSERQVMDKVIKHIVPFYSASAQAGRLRDKAYYRTKDGALRLNGALQIGRLVHRMIAMDQRVPLSPTRLVFVLRACSEWLVIGGDYNTILHKILLRTAFSILSTMSATLRLQFETTQRGRSVSTATEAKPSAACDQPDASSMSGPIMVEVTPSEEQSKNSNQSDDEDVEEIGEGEDMDTVAKKAELVQHWKEFVPTAMTAAIKQLLEGDLAAMLLPTWPRCILNEAVADFIIAQTVDGADAPSLGLPLLTDTNITLPSSVCKYEDLMARTMALLGCEHLPTQLAVYLLLDRQVETDLATLHTHQLETLMSSQDDLSVVEEVDTSNPIAPRQALLDFLQTHSPIATSHSRSTTPSNAPTPPETQGSPRTQPGTDRKGGDVRDLLKSVSSRHLTSPPPETVGSRRGTTPTPGTKASAHAHTHTQLQGYTATPQASPWTSAGGSYLLGWLLMLRYVDSASPAVRVGYAEALRVSGEVTTLLNAVAELLPYHVTRNANAIATHAAKLRDFDVCNLRRSDRGSAKINRTYGTAPDKTQSTHTHHTHHTHAQHTHTPSPQPQPQPTHTNATDGASVNGHSSSSGGVGSSSSIETSEVEGISLLAAHVYYQTLLHLPALARLWYNDLSRGARDRVDRYSQTVVSPMLIAQEISAAANASSSHLDLTLKASTVTKEVTAYYNLDEIALEVVIRLPANYPLGMVSVDSPSDMGIKSYRRWMLQMTTFLSSQNGSILDAVEMWKTNIDKRYDGVEECTVCYSVIHGSNYQLPKLRCRTCRKKFHSKCLYQWFQSSGGSTCPMCRSSFS